MIICSYQYVAGDDDRIWTETLIDRWSEYSSRYPEYGHGLATFTYHSNYSDKHFRWGPNDG